MLRHLSKSIDVCPKLWRSINNTSSKNSINNNSLISKYVIITCSCELKIQNDLNFLKDIFYSPTVPIVTLSKIQNDLNFLKVIFYSPTVPIVTLFKPKGITEKVIANGMGKCEDNSYNIPNTLSFHVMNQF